MEGGTLTVIALAALLLPLGLGVVQYVSVFVWSHCMVAGVLSTERDWLTSLPDRLDRMSRYLENHKAATDTWKALVGGLYQDYDMYVPLLSSEPPAQTLTHLGVGFF